MQCMKAPAFAGPLLSLLLLSACGPSSTGPGLGGDGQLAGDYSVSGNQLIIQSPERVRTLCNGDVLVRDTSEPHTDTSLFTLQGNRFRLLSRPDSVESIEPPYGTEAVVQRYSEYRRVSGSSGLEGRWQSAIAGYDVLSGTLSAENKATQDWRAQRENLRADYLTYEIEFASSKIWLRIAGRFGDYFLADWNGQFSREPQQDADSAYYDIAVSVADKETVLLKGNKTGETATIRFEPPTGIRRYSSDKPGRPTYSTSDPITQCPVDSNTGWFNLFLNDNRKMSIFFKKGAPSDSRGPKNREIGSIPGFLP